MQNRVKFMTAGVLWGLERAFFFVGILIYWMMFASEIIKYIVRFKATVKQINTIHTIQTERSKSIDTSIVLIFAFAWLIFAAMTREYINKRTNKQ